MLEVAVADDRYWWRSSSSPCIASGVPAQAVREAVELGEREGGVVVAVGGGRSEMRFGPAKVLRVPELLASTVGKIRRTSSMRESCIAYLSV